MTHPIGPRLRRLWDGLDRALFTPTERYHYGAFRVLYVGIIAWSVLRSGRLGVLPIFDQIEALAAAPPELYMPSLAMRWLPLPSPIPADWVPALTVVCELSLLMACLGVLTRASTLVAAVTMLYINGFVSSWGIFSHSAAVPCLVLLVIAVSPGVDALSVDRLLARAWRRLRGRPPLATRRAQPAWPALTILALLALIYFSAGVSKIRHGSIAWLDGETLGFYLDGEPPGTHFHAPPEVAEPDTWRDGVGLVAFTYFMIPRPPVARELSRSRPIMIALSVFSVAFELLFPLALFLPRTRLPLFVAGAGFHLGILWLMPPLDFLFYVYAYLVFIDWRRPRRWFAPVAARLRGLPRPA